MLREVVHFIRHAPATLRLKRKLPQAELYHLLIERAERAGMADQRAELVRDLSGEVLEIGSGTGIMFGHYGPGVRVTAIEPDDTFRALSEAPARTARAKIEVTRADAQALPFEAGRFDAAVVALVLCSVPSVTRVLGELARVLRPGGQLRLIEHVRSQGLLAGPLMSLLNPLWLKLNEQGCNWDRRPHDELDAAGFRIDSLRPFQLFSPGLPAFPMLQLRATRR